MTALSEPGTPCGVLIVAHAPLATALVALVKHVDPAWPALLACFDMPANLDRELAAQAMARLLADRGWRHCIVLVDVPGAGPSRAALRALTLTEGSVAGRVVSGVNGPMLLGLLSLLARDPTPDLDDAARYARSRGRRCINLVAPD